jgi:hypothetical protein
MKDITVRSWMELMGILYDIPKTSHGRHRSNFVYRGLADKSWDLKTSLIRLGGNYGALERPLLRSFGKYAQPGQIPDERLWMRLSVAQHYGLPTRLLDWTVSPKVALHFATFEEDHYDKDGVVWCINVSEARAVLPSKLQEVLKREYAFLFSIEMLEIIPSLDELDRLGDARKFLLFFEPPSLDGRIINQGAIMSVISDPTLTLNQFLESQYNQSNLYYRIIIPKELKWEARDKLDQDNVTERMLFPGLAGLSLWLKRYYGPGPAKANNQSETNPVSSCPTERSVCF